MLHFVCSKPYVQNRALNICIYHAVVQNGGTAESFSKRYCKKTLLHDLNEGLLKLSY